MTNATSCVRIDEDAERGGFVFSSTIPGVDETVLYTYGEIHHFFERVELGYFKNVADRAREEALKFGPVELTPLTAEYASPHYTEKNTVTA